MSPVCHGNLAGDANSGTVHVICRALNLKCVLISVVEAFNDLFKHFHSVVEAFNDLFKHFHCIIGSLSAMLSWCQCCLMYTYSYVFLLFSLKRVEYESINDVPGEGGNI
jgi:hypothetical protein